MQEETRPLRCLALVGMAGSGKTLCAQHLQQRGFYQFRFGGIVVDEVVRRGWAINPQNERIVREEFRGQDGMDAIAKRALPHLRAAAEANHTVVIDGLYSFSEYKTLMTAFPRALTVVAVVCDRAVRYARLHQRPERPLTAEEAEQRDWLEIEKIEKGGPIAIADYTLLNNGTPDSLLESLDSLLARLEMYP